MLMPMLVCIFATISSPHRHALQPTDEGASSASSCGSGKISTKPLNDMHDILNRWAELYQASDVCLRARPGTCDGDYHHLTKDAMFAKDGAFDPFDVLRATVDVVPRCSVRGPTRNVALGVEFVVQHGTSYKYDNLWHETDSLMPLFSDMRRKYVESLLPGAHSGQLAVVMTQVASNASLHSDLPWMAGMLKLVLPDAFARAPTLSCKELSATTTCFDKLLLHRQHGPWELQHPAQLPEAHLFQYAVFHSPNDARSFRARAKRQLRLPACSSTHKTLSFVYRTDARGYTNTHAIIKAAEALVKKHRGWRLSAWEPQVESLAKQAARFACTDLLVTVHGAHASNMIFLPEHAGVVWTAPCGCLEDSGKGKGGYMFFLAAQLGLCSWDALQDCPAHVAAPGTEGYAQYRAQHACNIHPHGDDPNMTASFGANWERPLAAAMARVGQRMGGAARARACNLKESDGHSQASQDAAMLDVGEDVDSD